MSCRICHEKFVFIDEYGCYGVHYDQCSSCRQFICLFCSYEEDDNIQCINCLILKDYCSKCHDLLKN